MSYLRNREINNLKSDVQSSIIAITADKEIFAAQLRNGLGEDIKAELRNPTKPSISVKWKVKFIRWWTEFKDKWRNLKINGK